MLLAFLEKHGWGLVVTLAVLFAGHSWLVEHDNRIIAEQTVKTAQVQIDSLQKQQQATAQVAQAQIVTLKKQAAVVKTPAQAIAAIPALTDVPLNTRAVPGSHTEVMVDVVPLFQELNQCKQDAVALNACSVQLADEQKIDAQKDVQIKALKKKKGFWARVKKDVIDTAVTVGIGLVAGYALHR